jgi:glucose-6-phosphate isomerase
LPPTRSVSTAFSLQAPHVFADLSKNRIDATTLALLLDLADQCGVAAHRDAMFSGAAINTTENRPVGHVWLRNRPPALANTAQRRY